MAIMASALCLAVYLPVLHAATLAALAATTAGLIATSLFAATPTELGLAVGLPLVAAGLALLLAKRLVQLSGTEPTQDERPDAGELTSQTLLELARRSLQPDVTQADMEPLMETLVDGLDCDAFTVWRNGDAEQFAGSLYCWAGRTPSGTEDIVWSRAPTVASAFSTGKPYVFSDVANVPMPDRSVYRRAGVSAAASAPVLVHGRWVGHVSLACHVGTRAWEADTVDAVRVVAEMVSSIWTREADAEQTRQVVAQRDRSLVIQRALGEASRMIFESDEGEDQIDRVLELVLSSTEARVVYVMKFRHHAAFGQALVPVALQVAQGAVVPKHLDSNHLVRMPDHYMPLLDGDPVMISDTSALGEPVRAWYTEFLPNTGAEIVFPVVSGTSVTGALGLTASTDRVWDAAEIRTMAAIAQMLGVARARGEARRALEDIVKAKDSFIASVSHQLRTPMAVVMGLSSELSARWSDFGQDEVLEFIDLIARESREVSDIIEDLLVAARASADSITVLPEMMRLDETVYEAIQSMSGETTHRLVSLQLDPVSTMADPLRVRQIVRNLVSNGHHHGGRQIFVRVGELNGTAVFEVSDNGEGIPLDRRDRIFEAYEAGESDGWNAKMGLGLTVSRQLARLMGGDVAYVHEPMPTFRLSLPVGTVVEQGSNLHSISHGAAKLSA
jgi:signal transduction histidine kinase